MTKDFSVGKAFTSKWGTDKYFEYDSGILSCYQIEAEQNIKKWQVMYPNLVNFDRNKRFFQFGCGVFDISSGKTFFFSSFSDYFILQTVDDPYNSGRLYGENENEKKKQKK